MAKNALRDAIIAHIQKSSGPQTTTDIAKGLALPGLIAQEIPDLVAAGVLQAGSNGTFTSKASIAAQVAAKELELQTLRVALMDGDPVAGTAAAPAVVAPASSSAAPVAAAAPAASTGK